MFKLYSKFLGFLHSKPTVNYIQPKSLNVYFANSLNPQFHWLNLKGYDTCSFEVIQTQHETTNVFELKANFVSNKEVNIIDLAKFETRKEAEAALLVLRNKFFAIEKSLVKTTGVVVSMLLLLGLLTDFSGSTLKKFISTNPTEQNAQINNAQLPPFMLPNNATAQDLQQQLLQAQAPLKTANPMEVNHPEPQTQPTSVPVTIPEASGNPNVNSLVNSLGK